MRTLTNGVKWDDRDGIGFYEADPTGVYNESYFEKYIGYAHTELGKQITAARIDLVDDHIRGAPLLDIGIGCGQFILHRHPAPTFGYDINTTAIQWLLNRKLWKDPWVVDVDNVSLWDAFEHLRRPELLLTTVRKYVFMSIPIFDGPEHVVASKHFRPTEHFWYFTRAGLLTLMAGAGFRLIDENAAETVLGRDGIRSFVFRRNT